MVNREYNEKKRTAISCQRLNFRWRYVVFYGTRDRRVRPRAGENYIWRPCRVVLIRSSKRQNNNQIESSTLGAGIWTPLILIQ